MVKTIGIVGLGRVGIPVAKTYIEAGYKVFGYARRKEVIHEFKEMGGTYCASPKEVARVAQVLFVLVLNDSQVKDVVLGENGMLKRAAVNSTIICMSTINRFNLELVAKKCEKNNVNFVDCPFTGGPARVETASLTLIAAAKTETLNRIEPILDLIGNVVRVGNSPGLGQAVKHCNQLLVGTTHAATMEVITLARNLGLDADIVTKVIGSGIAGSDYFRLLSESVLEGKPSPGGLGQMCKDVAIVANTVDEVDMAASVLKATAKYFKQAEELNMQNREGADLIEVVEKKNKN
jgi:3-hydroxyisobutyrate dehydrogenase-like beta-hydroxyacid dehydrogenase